jgi:hypothetical protein
MPAVNEPAGDRWVDAGRFTTCAVIDERIYALLYWSAGWASLKAPAAENLSDSGAGWFLVFSDDPNLHIKLGGSAQLPPLSEDASRDEIDVAMRSATLVAGRIIRQRLGDA